MLCRGRVAGAVCLPTLASPAPSTVSDYLLLGPGLSVSVTLSSTLHAFICSATAPSLTWSLESVLPVPWATPSTQAALVCEGCVGDREGFWNQESLEIACAQLICHCLGFLECFHPRKFFFGLKTELLRTCPRIGPSGTVSLSPHQYWPDSAVC